MPTYRVFGFATRSHQVFPCKDSPHQCQRCTAAMIHSCFCERPSQPEGVVFTCSFPDAPPDTCASTSCILFLTQPNNTRHSLPTSNDLTTHATLHQQQRQRICFCPLSSPGPSVFGSLPLTRHGIFFYPLPWSVTIFQMTKIQFSNPKIKSRNSLSMLHKQL